MGNLTFDWNVDSSDVASARKRLKDAVASVDWDFAGFNPSARPNGIHALHWYPAAFPPALVATMLDLFAGRGNVVVDPFCGSAVVPIEAWGRGMTAYGFDINRFAVQLGRAKADLIQSADTDACDELVADCLSFRDAERRSWAAVKEANLCGRAGFGEDALRWFTVPVLREIALLKCWINCGRTLPAKWRNVLSVALSSILHGKLSVVRDYHYTYIVDRSKVKAECRTETDVAAEFADKLRSAFVDGALARAQMDRVKSCVKSQTAPPRFGCARADQLKQYVTPGSVDIVLTSPPYFGMNDYVRSQYLSWLIFQWDSYHADLGNESGSRRLRTKANAREDFHKQMELSFRAVEALLRPGGFLIVVFGSSHGKFMGEDDSVTRMRNMLESGKLRLFWSGTRRIRFRKINNTPYRSEVLWVFQRQ